MERVSCGSEEVETRHEPAFMINPKVAIAEASSPGHFPVSFASDPSLLPTFQKAQDLKLKFSNLHPESSGGSLSLPRNGDHSLGTSFFLQHLVKCFLIFKIITTNMKLYLLMIVLILLP